MKKLYVVVRADLPPGPRAVQACHAALDFARDHQDTFLDWSRLSNYLIVKEAPDEEALRELVRQAERRGLKHSAFTEPDYGDSLTAVAFEPDAKRLCARFPLALSEVPKRAA